MEKHHKPIELNALDAKKKKSMTSRILVGVVLAAVALPALFVGSWFWFALMSFFLGFATYEIIHARNKKYHWFIWAFTYFIVIVYVYWFLFKSNMTEYIKLKDIGQAGKWTFELERWYDEPVLSIYAALSAMGVYFVVALIDKDFDFFDVCYFFLMTILVGMGFQCMMYLRFHPFNVFYGSAFDQSPDALFRFWSSTVLLIFVVLCAFGNDTMAYFTGVFIGKHQMTPRISPNKTWEGFLGGWLLGGSLALGFALICDACGFPLLPALAVFSGAHKWWGVVILSYSLPIIAVVGDLTFSLIKRYFGFKDYGTLLRSHGGVLDRTDSLIFCSILCSILVVILEKGWRFFI